VSALWVSVVAAFVAAVVVAGLLSVANVRQRGRHMVKRTMRRWPSGRPR
jgi:hypothetical protein